LRVSNLILDSLESRVRDRLHLTKLDLPSGKILFESGSSISTVYFPTSAVVSLVVILKTGEMIEAAMVGRDGIVGAAAALDGRISLSRAIVQIEGQAWSCGVAELKSAALENHALLALLIRHEQVVYAQAQQSAACNITHNLTARLCRWLLRARDLSASDTLPFTQEFLGEMLGVERSTVSITAHTLQEAGLIKYRRGKIQIVNVDGLQESACECYSTVKCQYDTLLGKLPNRDSAGGLD
jgi:CRP-like cAMP-binding protein